MRKYLIIIPIFIVSLIIISFYVFRNSQISKISKELTNIQQQSFKMEILSHKQLKVLDSLNKTTSHDDVVKINDIFQEKFHSYIKNLKKLNDSKLSNLVLNMEQKNSNLINIYEDIKTDNAVIKNSIFWLEKSYKTYIVNIGKIGNDKEFTQYIFDVINSNYRDIIVDIEDIHPKIYEVDKLKIHLQIINKKQKSLLNLNKELKNNSLIKDINIIIQEINSKLQELQNETASIIKSLLISSLFLLIFGLVVYIREIMSSREIQKLKNELQQFVDALNQSAIVSKTDLQGDITYVNDNFCTYSGYKAEEVLGQPHNIIRHQNMQSSVFKELWETIQAKKIFKATIQNTKKNGDSYYVDSVIIPILDVDGEIEEYLAVRYDVTELILSRDKAIVAEKAKDEFLSNMSHELRTPLNSINGFSTILKRLIKDEKQVAYLQSIIDSSDSLLGIVNDILDLSKLQSGKFSLDYHHFNPSEKIPLLLSRFDTQLIHSKLIMNKKLDKTLNTTINGDWLRISQVITNLVSNAIKFSPKDSEIYFSTKYEDSKLVIVVKDNGIGMSQEIQDRIFKPFEQADSSTTREYGGTGLGLSIVLNLIEQMKAEINLVSKDGEGSTFRVIIPLIEIESPTEIEDKTELEEDEFESLNGHILIAEDNKTNQMFIGILMSEFGLSYKIANDGVEAVDMFGKEKFDLVLMDENMPNMNGSEAMKRIHTKYGKETPIVALTANAMSGDKEKFLELGMSGYVSKPIDDEELYRVISKLLK